MTEREELLRLREVLRAAKAVLECRIPPDAGRIGSYIPDDRLNWLSETITALSET